MNMIKATELDWYSIVDFRYDNISVVVSELYNSGEISEDQSRTIFVTLPKTPDTNER